MVRPLISGLSGLCEVFETKPLNGAEQECGTMAFSALLYENGGNINATTLVLMFLGGITAPRIAEHRMKAARKKPDLATEKVRDAVAAAEIPAAH